jgi:hypothetical protein
MKCLHEKDFILIRYLPNISLKINIITTCITITPFANIVVVQVNSSVDDTINNKFTILKINHARLLFLVLFFSHLCLLVHFILGF